MRDLHSHTLLVSVAIAALDADTTPVAIDLQGHKSAEILLHVGIGGITFSGTNKVEFVLTHSDDDVTYTDVTTDDILGGTVASGGIIKSLEAAHAAAAAYRFGYKGDKRHLKLLIDFSGTHGTATPISAMVLLGHGTDNPQVDQA